MKHINLLKFSTAALLFIFLFFSCEPISVSINSKGDIAFARNEGVFYFNTKSMKLTMLDWNYGNETIPIIVRWAPNESMLACTVKLGKNNQNNEVYLIDLSGKKNKIYSVDKVISQMEWSPDSKYISLAQVGQDTDMAVADLVLINVTDGMSKIIVSNTGDVHRWLDNSKIVFMKIAEKNKNNSDILKGELSVYDYKTQNTEKKLNTIVSKTGGLDLEANKKDIVFSAIDVNAEKQLDFAENMKSDMFAYIYNLSNNKFEKLSDNIINFIKYSPDGSKILIKNRSPNDYSGNMNLGYVNMKDKKIKNIITNVTDTVSSNSQNIQVYPAWLDNNNVVYIQSINSYGSNGQSLQLMSAGINDGKKKNYQPVIETEINKLIEQKGGY
ncbi:MAG: hypothetical protein JXB50_15385 [Spirochaetes bacterium]|nr:hypothetical protein [Spirochaetota bacterium]